jgi:hypothetical protein
MTEVSQLFLFFGNFDADSEKIVLVIDLISFFFVDDLILRELLLYQIQDSPGISHEGSQDQYFAVCEPSSFFLLQ